MVQRKRRLEEKLSVFDPGNILTKIQRQYFFPRKYLYRVGAAVGFVLILYMIYRGDDPEIVEEALVPTPVSVEVLNGCGVSGVAAQMTEFLRLNDIDVLITKDADSSDYNETIIIGRDLRFDHAGIISQLTGITNRTVDAPTDSTINVTIIIGKDYKNFKPFIN